MSANPIGGIMEVLRDAMLVRFDGQLPVGWMSLSDSRRDPRAYVARLAEGYKDKSHWEVFRVCYDIQKKAPTKTGSQGHLWRFERKWLAARVRDELLVSVAFVDPEPLLNVWTEVQDTFAKLCTCGHPLAAHGAAPSYPFELKGSECRKCSCLSFEATRPPTSSARVVKLANMVQTWSNNDHGSETSDEV